MTESIENVCCKKDGMQGAKKLKVLALHGYRQNAEVFRQKTGSFRKLVHKWAHFTYVTAPHKVFLVDDIDNAEVLDEGQGIDSEQYGWFFNRDNKTYRGIRKGGPAIGFEESLKFIEEVFEKEGPFDGILAFSQGACFLGLLCDLQNRRLITGNTSIAVLLADLKNNSELHPLFTSQRKIKLTKNLRHSRFIENGSDRIMYNLCN